MGEIRVDARPVERDANGFIRVDPGTHELAIEAPHHETAMRTLRATAGEELTLDIALSPRREAESDVRQPEATPAIAAPPWNLLWRSKSLRLVLGCMEVLSSDAAPSHQPVTSNVAR